MARLALVTLLVPACVVLAESPVEKVISLLEELKTETEEEGKAEAKTYDEFACFCKETTAEKSASIKASQDKIEEFAAVMQEKKEGSDEKKAEILELDQVISKIDKELSQITTMREAEKTKYEANTADLGKGISELEGAIADAKGGKMALSHLSSKIRKTLLVADALNMGAKQQRKVSRKLSAFLQSQEMASEDPEEGEAGESNFHSDDLIATLEELDKQFLARKAEIDLVNGENKKNYNSMMQTKTSEKTEAEESKGNAEEKKAALDEELAEATKSIVEEQTTLKDDQAYLKDLTARCELGAREWDQRSQMRGNEVAALTKALDIVSQKVKDNDAAVNKRSAAGLLQQPVEAPQHLDARVDIEESDIGDAGLSFLQGGLRQRLRGIVAAAPHEADARRNRAITGLVQEGERLKSPVLASMAMKLHADPFTKVKRLIQNLIEKLLQQAADEATKKGWCDSETAKAGQTRDSNMGKIMSTNAELTSREAEKASLEEEIVNLKAEIVELNGAVAKQTKEREDEKAENMDTLEKAKEGLAAVKDAHDVLDSYYKGAAKAQVSLVDESAVQEPPEKAGGAYKGNQNKAGGILAMLETIISDFEHTIKETEKAEKAAHREFTKFLRTSKSSIAAKETAQSSAEFGLKECMAAITQAMNDLDKHQKVLDETLKEIEDLKPACESAGMSAEDRAQKRKDEIKALKMAICEMDPKKTEEDCQ